MLGEILLKMLTVLTPDDVRRMKAAGRGAAVEKILNDLDGLNVSWQSREFGQLDSKVWAEIQIRLNELWAVLREG